MRRIAWLIPACLLLAGCQQGGNPFLLGQGIQNNAAPGSLAAQNPLLNPPSPESQALTARLQDAERRLALLDSQNRELTSQVAQAQQIVQNEREQKRLIQQQLADAGNKLRDVMTAKDDVERRANALYASQQRVGGATITANNSVRSSLQMVQIAGLEVRQEGTTVRIEIPADRLFSPGTAQVAAQANPVLDDVASAIARSYPKQLIVVEGHTDNSVAGSPAASHQLTAAQAHAVLDYLVSQKRLPANQISSMAFGGHRPRMSNASPQGQAKNRRIEVVIYPETIDGK